MFINVSSCVVQAPKGGDDAHVKRTQSTRLQNMTAADAKLKNKGQDLWDPANTYIVDVDQGQQDAQVMKNFCPTITRARGGDRWNNNKNKNKYK